MPMSCLDCGAKQRCLTIPHLIDGAFTPHGHSTSWEKAWVCPRCFPDMIRRFGGS